jgi:hypothetical protein
MYIGKRVLVKYEGKLIEGNVITIYREELEIILDNKQIIKKYYWEIGKIKEENNE